MRRLKKVVIMVLTLCVIFAQCISVQAASSTKSTTGSAKYSVTLNKSVITMKKGAKVTLKTVLNSAAQKKGVTWSSSKKSVATVSSKGKITAKKNGTTTITATVKGSKVKATCKIVVGTPVTKISLNQKSVSLQTGEKFTLKATVSPKKATNSKVTYKSSNKKVAKVSSKGVITAVSQGTAKITVTAADGSGVKAVCKVTVSAPAADTSNDTNNTTDQQTDTQDTSSVTKIPVAVVIPTVEVADEEELVAALKASGAAKIVYTSDEKTDLTIPEGNYATKTLELNAPNASVVNNGNFARVTINAIASNTYTENSSNSIYFNAPTGHIVIGETGIANITLSSEVSDGPVQQLQLENRGTIDSVTLPVKAELTIEGTNSVPVIIGENAGDSAIVASTELNITASASWNMTILPGAENTTATVENADCTPEISGVGLIPVVITNDNVQVNIVATTNESLTESLPKVTVSGKILNRYMEKQEDSTDEELSKEVIANGSDCNIYLIPRTNENSDMTLRTYESYIADLTPVVSDENGDYSIADKTIGNYWMIVTKDEFRTVIKELVITSTSYDTGDTGSNFHNDAITLLSEEIAASEDVKTISGTILDGATGTAAGVAGIQVKLRAGSGNLTGAVEAETVTDENGSYSFENVKAGVYTVEFNDLRANLANTDIQYNGSSINIIVGTGTDPITGFNVTLDRKVVTITGQGQLMFTLTWGNQESGASSDIDSHLVGPKADGQGKFHVYYGDATYSVNGETYADLDYDDTEWEGPEHVTVYEQTDGVYSFYVHNYSEGDSKYDNMTMMAKSGIQVRITLGTASYTYNCPNQTGNLWYVCDYNSVTHTIIPKNIMYDYSGDTSNIGMKDTDRIINIIESAEELLNEYEQTEARTAIAKKLAALKEKAAAVTDEADTSALYDEASRIKTDITELNYIRSKIDYYEEDEVPVALDAKVTSLENKLAEAETTDAYDSLGEEIDLIYGALYRIDEIRTLIPEFDANEELTTLGERVNKLEEQILAASEDSEYDVISEEVAKIYAPLSSGYSIAVVKYEGVIEYGYESGGVATDDAYNVIGARYIIERNENASNQDVLDNLKFTTENDVSYTITQLADNDKYQALVKVTNSTTGYVKNVYVTIYEY